MRIRQHVFLLAAVVILIAPFATRAQVTTGSPPFGSFSGGPDVIDNANLNTHYGIPVFHKNGRGTNFAYDLSYDSSVWYPVLSGSTQAWNPVFNWGWTGGLSGAGVAGYISYTQSYLGYCFTYGGMQVFFDEFNNFVYHDSWDLTHPLAGQIVSESANIPVNDLDGCHLPNTNYSISGTVTDGSGLAYSVSTTFQHYTTISSGTIYTPAGSVVTPPLGGASGTGNFTDRNGNENTADGSGHFYDTLSSTTPALTVAGSGTPSSPMTFTYTAPSGASPAYTMKFTSQTVRTNFACSGISEFGPTSENLVSEIDLPDDNPSGVRDRYTFTYEQTPGYSGDVTGRIATVTLPTGGSITYAYSGGGSGVNGISCVDGGGATMTRTLSDGAGWSATWTYARTNVSGAHWQTIITDPERDTLAPNGNQTVLQFQGIYETQRLVYQGLQSGGSLLRTINTCYNGASSPCTGTAITAITQRSIQTVLPNNKQSEHDDFWNAYGAPTETDDYDYGTAPHGSLLKKVLATYATLGNITGFRQTITTQNASGATVSETSYNYDQSTPTTTSGTPQHVSVTGSRGNLTSVNLYTVGSTYLTRTSTYYDTGNLYTTTDVNGGVTTYNYGSGSCGNSFATSITEAVTTLSTSMTWNCTGGVELTSVDENNQTTTTSYTDPYFWRPASVTDPTGAITTYCYGLIVSGSCGTNPNQTESTLSFNSGNSAVDTLTTLDGLARVRTKQTRQTPNSPNFDTTETDYDSFGRPNRATLPYTGTAGQTNSSAPATTSTYDALSRPLTVQDGGGGSATYTYGQANDGLVTLGPAPTWDSENTKRRQLEYDALNRVTSVCEITSGTAAWPGGNCAQTTSQTGYWTEYTYDPMGNLLTVTQNAQMSGSTQTRTFDYDLLSRMTSETVPEIGASGNGTATYTYDSDSTCGTSNGDLVKKVDAAGDVICLTFDALHRQLTTTYPSGTYASVTPQKHFVYDGATVNSQVMAYPKSRLAEAYTCFSPCSSKTTDVGMSYSVRGELTDLYELTPNSAGFYYHSSQTYWANGIPDQLSGNLGLPSVTYGPDGEGRPSSVSASGQNPVSSTSYNQAGLPLSIALGSGSGDSDSYTYDPNTNRMTQYKFTVNSISLTANLGWNANSTFQSQDITDGFNSADTQNCSYQYDDITRLTNGNCGGAANQTFSYDPFSNISKSGSPYSFQPIYSESTNRIATVGSQNATYDSDGNATNDTFHTYTWDGDGHAISVDSGGSDAVTLSYDALGRMIEQHRSTGYTQIAYSPSGQKLALMSSQTLQKAIVALTGSGYAVYSSSGLLYYAHADLLGTIRLGTTSARGLQFDTAYAPFGETYASTGTPDPAYTGQMNDTAHRSDTAGGLYDFPLREYSTQGRWPNPDPAGQGGTCPNNPQTQNRYAYVSNNPMNYTDPLGARQGCDRVFDPFCGGGGGGCGCDPTVDPTCGSGCDPDDPNCFNCDPFSDPLCPCSPAPPPGGGGGGGGGTGNGDKPRPFPWMTLPFGFFGSSDAGPCSGTTDCSYYKGQCKKATTPSSKAYYCVAAPSVCNTTKASALGRALANCVRLSLQQNDKCLNIPDANRFLECEESNHAFAFAYCAGACILFQ